MHIMSDYRQGIYQAKKILEQNFWVGKSDYLKITWKFWKTKIPPLDTTVEAM